MNKPEIKENYDLTSLTTFGIPAKAKWFASYSSLRELKYLAKSEQFRNEEILHIGGGSNLLFVSDFNGLVLHSEIKGIQFYRKNDDTVFVIAGAGENWAEFVERCVAEGYGGLENLAGIPGKVGASAIQNVGAYGVEAGERIHAVECYDRMTGETVNFTREECKFGYRDSIFKNEAKGRYFVLRVSFRLEPSDIAGNLEYGPLKDLESSLGHKPVISEVCEEVKRIRDSKLPNPAEIGSAGSFFKNPIVSREYYEKVVLRNDPEVPHYPLEDDKVKIPAGWLIDHAGLKGKRIGSAEVYPKQCLVIANTGDASADDVVRLSNEIRNTVRNRYGISLSPEVNFIDTDIFVSILGSGTSKGIPEIACGCDVCRSEDSRDKRLRSSIFLRTHGLNLMIDTSPDLRTQVLEAGITDLDAVLLTHIHYDHVGGIDDLRTFTATEPLRLYMLPDVAEDLRRRIDYCFRAETYPGVASFDVHEIDAHRPFYINGLKIIPIPVMHGKLPIVGYRIGNFAYITDASSISEESMELLKDLDVLIINALRQRQHFAHFSLDDALDVIRQLRPGKAFLTHLCHEMGKHEDVEKTLPENVAIAFDGMEIVC